MRRWLWLALALALVTLGAVLMSADEKMTRPPDLDQVEFPTYLRTEEHARLETRRRELPLPKLPADADEEPEEVTRDPLLRALPAGAGSTLVVEANAVRHSELGELLVDCLRQSDDDPFAELQRHTGLDVLEDLDRIAVAGDTLLIAGHFAGAKWDEVFSEQRPQPYGDAGRLYCGAGEGECSAVWRDELVVTGPGRAEVQAAIDRIEGRAEVVPAIGEAETYGEIYGVLDPEELARMVPEEQRAIADTLRQVVDDVGLHVDAMSDVALVAELRGEDEAQLADLAKSVGAALALARMTAKAQGEDELADLLARTRVSPYGNRFSLELALPKALLQQHLEEVCRRHHEESPEPDPSEGVEDEGR
jgi:hypothetical protein